MCGPSQNFSSKRVFIRTSNIWSLVLGPHSRIGQRGSKIGALKHFSHFAVRNEKCPHARKLAIAAHSRGLADFNDDGSYDLWGYHCKPKSLGYENGKYVCRNGQKLVRYQLGA